MRKSAFGFVVVIAAAASAQACGGAAPIANVPKVAPKVAGCGRALDPATTPKPIAVTHMSATVALAKLGSRTLAYVADEDSHAVHVVDVDSGKALGSTPVAGRPGQLMFLADGRLLVALRDKGQVAVLEPTATPEKEPLDARCTIAADTEPLTLATTPDDATLFVAHAWGHKLVAYDGKTLARQWDVSLAREPRQIVVSDDGKKVFVAHAVGGKASIVEVESRRILGVVLHAVDQGNSNDKPSPKRRNVAADSVDTLRRQSCQGFALAKTEAPATRVLFPQVLVDPGDTTQKTEGYGRSDIDQTEVANVAVLDQASAEVMAGSLNGPDAQELRQFQTTDRVDHDHSECLLPRAAAYYKKTQTLLVACMGIDELVAFDALAASPSRAEKRRWSVASGPNGVAVDADKERAIVWSQFERVVDVVSLGGPDLVDAKTTKLPPVVRIALAAPTPAPSIALALGRVLFHTTSDDRISHDGRACASCHPDGRDDALTWATPNGPRRSIMLAGRVDDTAPFSWTGTEHDLKEHVGITFDRLKGLGGLKGMELEAISTYVRALTPPPAVVSNDPRIAHGAEIFTSAATACSSCHTGPLFTDNKHHDVQSKTEGDKTGSFNTPSLRFVSARAPYFHDGRYATLRDLLTAADRKMGHTQQLSTDDLEALEAYLRTL